MVIVKRPDWITGSALRDWGQNQRWLTATLSWLVNLWMIVAGLWLLTWLPASILLGVIKRAPRIGTGPTEAVVLNLPLKSVMGLTMLALLAISALVAGFIRSLVRGGMFDRWWAIVGFMPCSVALFIWIGHTVRSIINVLPNAGENYLIVAYVTAWLLIVGYVAKVPWDEFRDRCAAIIDKRWEFRNVPPSPNEKGAE